MRWVLKYVFLLKKEIITSESCNNVDFCINLFFHKCNDVLKTAIAFFFNGIIFFLHHLRKSLNVLHRLYKKHFSILYSFKFFSFFKSSSSTKTNECKYTLSLRQPNKKKSSNVNSILDDVIKNIKSGSQNVCYITFLLHPPLHRMQYDRSRFAKKVENLPVILGIPFTF